MSTHSKKEGGTPAARPTNDPPASPEAGPPAGRSWGFGDSSRYVPGAPPEPRWVTAAWIFVPTLLAALLLAAMASHG